MRLQGAPAAGSLDNAARAGRWSVGLAAGTLAVLVAAYAVVAVALATGGQDAISDTWVGYLGGIALIGALVAALTSFALALPAWVRHSPVARLPLPLALLPSLVLVVAAVELFWIE